MSNLVRALPILLAVLMGSGQAFAAASSWAETEVGRLRLISARNAVDDNHEIRLGLEFKLKKDWKVYWRSPGEAGYAPKLDWTGSANLQEIAISWPVPERFTILGIETVGYKGDLVLPLTARSIRQGQGLDLKLSLDVLACSDICVPVLADLRLSLPAGTDGLSNEAGRISQYQSRVPGDGAAHGLKLLKLERRGKDRLFAQAEADPPFIAPDLFIEGPEGALFSAPKVLLSDRNRRASFEIAATQLPKDGLAGRELTITLADGGRGLEARQIPGDGASASASPASWLGMIGLALLGGLILNLMPCVLPVLSLKVLGLISHGGAGRRQIRLSFVASAAGILTSFLLLGLGAVGLKLTGNAVGWGLQFQEPMFLSFLAALVVLFAANMAGFFEIGLPAWIGGSGRALGHPHGLIQHFAAGMFATLLATPCSAPFLGTAVGFALAAGPLEIVIIFLCLGLGMAGPYLAVAALPQLASRLPRSGPWMVSLKRLLARVLVGTALWLIWVIASQAGRGAAHVVLALLGMAGFMLALRHRLKAPLFGYTALIAILLAIPAPRFVPDTERRAIMNETFWQPFDEAAIPRLVQQGKRVFVDVTADWCVTCQVNKRLVLSRESVQALLTDPGVVAMQADWTRPNETIGTYLAKFGRYGIPFNVVYGPSAPDGLPLPELLSEQAVIEALGQAK
ncbi:MAG: thioredoxin family protein [Alphaproteobacteria bacterium]|nr:thioredoxin family protein [Alphaproteobacteria bacterium]